MSLVYYFSRTPPCPIHIESISGPRSEHLLSLPFYSENIRKFPEWKLPRECLGRYPRWGPNVERKMKNILFSQWSFLVRATQGVCLRNMSSLPLVIEAKPLNNAQLVWISTSSPTNPSAKSTSQNQCPVPYNNKIVRAQAWTHVNPWLFHFNVWQNSLQIKKFFN